VSGRSAAAVPLRKRYSRSDLSILSADEQRRFVDDGPADPQENPTLAWELLYRLEPELYDRLVQAERLHPSILEWLPQHVDRIVEVGAGSGRLTLPLLGRCDDLTAIEPAAPLRELLRHKLVNTFPYPVQEESPSPLVVSESPSPFVVSESPSPLWGGSGRGSRIHLISGFLDALPLPDRSAELVIACSVLTPEPAHGGDRGLAEMERVCTSFGTVAIVWPNHPEWLVENGYRYLSFPGEMAMDFASLDEAIELARVFYPEAVSEIQVRGERRVPYEILRVNPPRDLAFKVIA
jgi:SAM-dependent methyltransferase